MSQRREAAGDYAGMITTSPPAAQIDDAFADEQKPYPEAQYAALTGHDRCDSCPAAAKSFFTFASGALLMCGHHTRIHLDKLLDSALRAWIEPADLWPEPELQRRMEALAQKSRPAAAKRNLDSFV